MENIAHSFMAKHDAIKITLRAPEIGYEEIMQRNLRDAVTNTLPDVAFHGLNRQRTLLERNIPIDLRPLMDADPGTKQLGFSPILLSLGQVGDKQTGHRLFAVDIDPLLQRRTGEGCRRRSRQTAPELERGRGTRRRHR